MQKSYFGWLKLNNTSLPLAPFFKVADASAAVLPLRLTFHGGNHGRPRQNGQFSLIFSASQADQVWV
jgi:hypothetical protein